MKPEFKHLTKLCFLVLCFHTPLTGECYYNPSTGRWLNRDPAAERGGPNLVNFVSNKPLDRYDVLGLILPPTDMPALNLCHYCKCLSPEVSFHPGATNQLEWGYYTDFNGVTTFGNAIHVKWQVLGVASKCKFSQIERGYIRATPPPNGMSLTKKGNWNKTTSLRLEYWDHMGLKFNSWDNGNWDVIVDEPLSIRVRCQSSDGTLVEQDLGVPAPPARVSFPPPPPLPHFPGK